MNITKDKHAKVILGSLLLTILVIGIVTNFNNKYYYISKPEVVKINEKIITTEKINNKVYNKYFIGFNQTIVEVSRDIYDSYQIDENIIVKVKNKIEKSSNKIVATNYSYE